MHFSIHKKITLKKQPRWSGLVNNLILIIAIPVILIALISLSIYFLFIWVKGFIVKGIITDASDEHYHFELDLIRNEHVHIVLVEDELDDELTQMNEAWMKKVYQKETCLYRARTVPAIPALEGGICCFYCKEQSGGVLLQLIPAQRTELSSQLVFLDYRNMDITLINEMGPFFLYNDNRNAHLIRGFNKKENINLEIISSE